MNLQEKQQAVTDLTAKLKDANAFYLTDFTGLSVKRMTQLRSRLRKAGVEYVVVKNTLAQRVLENLQLNDVSSFFTGPTGVAISRGDAVTAAKVIDDFARENDNKPSVKAGMVDHRVVTAKEVGKLAKLPPREQLLAELVGCMEAPMQQLLYCLTSKMSEFVGLVEALKAQKEGVVET
jgi:large subunit ribosomal protein L10